MANQTLSGIMELTCSIYWILSNHQPNIKLFIYSFIVMKKCIKILQQTYQNIQNPQPFFSTTFSASIHARKLVPFLAAQETFKAQAEAKYLADELEAKLAPAEAVDRWSGWQRGRIEDRSSWISEDVFKFIKIKQIWRSIRKKGGACSCGALAVALAVRCSFLR